MLAGLGETEMHGDRGKLAGPRSGFLGKPLVISIL